MKLSEHLSVTTGGKIEAFVDLGAYTPEDQKTLPCNHGLGMFVPLVGSWTQVLGVFGSHENVKGTHAYDKLSSLLTNKRLLNDIRQMSPHMQTFSVESFHAIINRFALKAYAYSLMFARTALAALHYNENADKGQAVTLSGELRWKVKQPKARNREASVSSVKQETTYGYVNRLFCTLEKYANGGTPYDLPAKPPHVASSLGPVDKTSLVQSHFYRFRKQ
ncbi:hypothetical protein HPB49_016122 [Dermacentor silvarum]|uniref:Uncharacterized protein n=1 Tax=Dermacentor silvarum TaxID=543639 RepID=A0ACB8CYE9_DERSI|nr:hypothetical protein HPB49_016122 [Dermacentor silvarum]